MFYYTSKGWESLEIVEDCIIVANCMKTDINSISNHKLAW